MPSCMWMVIGSATCLQTFETCVTSGVDIAIFVLSHLRHTTYSVKEVSLVDGIRAVPVVKESEAEALTASQLN